MTILVKNYIRPIQKPNINPWKISARFLGSFIVNFTNIEFVYNDGNLAKSLWHPK